MNSIKERAEQFFDACETGKGWDVCKEFCHPDASFSVQAGALADVDTVESYTEWTKGLPSLPTYVRHGARKELE